MNIRHILRFSGCKAKHFSPFLRERILNCLLPLLALYLFFASSVRAETLPVPFPDIALPSVNSQTNSMPASHARKLSDFSEPILVINVYSWFCAPCQAEGNDLVRLHEMVTEECKDEVRILGIAAGDPMALVDRYKNKFNIPYLMFPDPDLTLHEQMGSPSVPIFFLVKQTETGLMLMHKSSGSIHGNPEALFDTIKHIIAK